MQVDFSDLGLQILMLALKVPHQLDPGGRIMMMVMVIMMIKAFPDSHEATAVPDG